MRPMAARYVGLRPLDMQSSATLTLLDMCHFVARFGQKHIERTIIKSIVFLICFHPIRMAGFGASASSLLQYGGRKQREKNRNLKARSMLFKPLSVGRALLPGGAAARLPAKRANIEFPKGTYRVCQRQTYRLKDRARTVTLLHLFLLRALQAPFCMSVSGKRKKING